MKLMQELWICVAAATLLAGSTAGLPAAATSDVSPAPVSKKFSRRHCQQCGVVESTRYIEASGGQPARYEFVVRMRDGSKRTRRVSSLYKWRTGDHVMFGGGEGTSP